VAKNINKRLGDRGFTIVELMVALTVLSTILLISTVMLIQISKLYTKGVNLAQLQNATRTISGDLASGVQFSGAIPIDCPDDQSTTSQTCAVSSANFGGITVYSYCINTTRYSYVMNRELGQDNDPGNTNTPHVLWRDSMPNGNSCNPLDITLTTVRNPDNSINNGYEMAPEHTRLNRFYVDQRPDGSGVYQIDIWMAFGDQDLLTTVDSVGNRRCNDVPDSQYCATSELTTTVARRLD